MPLNTDCPAMTIDATPPIAFSLHIEPSNMPKLMKINDVTMESNIPNRIVILNILV